MRPTFCGLSITDLKTAIGWGPNQTSSLSVGLIEDPTNGDRAAPPPNGSPVFFEFFGMRFSGLLQRFARKRSQSGDPAYEATVLDPREVLEGTQVVVGQFMGAVAPVPNVLNAFGWWENTQGYGSSQANESGMPWTLIRTALLNLADAPSPGPYGGPLTFLGHSYSLDLSELPVPDPAYRVGGTVVGLLEVVAALCEDGGRDFFVELRGFKIKVRTVSRLNQPPLGTIARYTDTNWGNVLRAEDGLEVRNETTSAFLVGGDVCVLQLSDDTTASSFWGYDVSGAPILGVPGIFTFTSQPDPNKPPVTLGTTPTEFMDLNATGIADIVGSLTYRCSTLEMRLAMVNYESWAAFVRTHRPDIGKLITSPFKNQGWQGALFKPDVVDDTKANAAGMTAVNQDTWSRLMRLYEFVKAYGTDFYGKKYVVAVPQVLARQDPETLRWSFSMEPAEGGWLPEEAAPLGLPPLAADVMRTQDGRYRAFVAFADVTGLDMARVSPSDSVLGDSPLAEAGLGDSPLYLRANVDRQLLFLPTPQGSQPAVLLTLGSAIYEEAQDAFGDMGIVAWATLAMTPEEANKKVFKGPFGNVGMKIWPAARGPDAFAVPLKSNVLTYGPWYVAGAAGKVKVEVDPSLTPWNYGGYAPMEAAASSRVLNAVTNMQVSESGLLEVAGPPVCSLGDTLQEGGPNVTGIEVSYGKEGVTTTYRFQTFTPRFGVFSKNLAERIRKAGTVGAELRRAVRASANEAAAGQDAAQTAVRGFLANAPAAIKMQTPHEAVICHSEPDADAQGNFLGWRVCPKSLTYEETVALARADDDEAYRRAAVMSWDGLLRPYSTNPAGSPGMPGLTPPTNTGGAALTSAVLNPLVANNDIAYLAWGQTYSRLHAYRAGNDPADTRAIALRGPLIVAGWGYDVQGRPVPGDGSGNWAAGLLRRSDTWKVGPADLLWDDTRGVWTAHGTMVGTTVGTLPAGGSGAVSVLGGGGTRTVWNCFSVGVSGSTTVMANYVPDLNRWYVIAADCVG